jgi:TRAP-type C4-dicarboxylate transport system permease small subunit
MRRLLDGFYLVCGALAATFLFAILAVVIAQVALNIVDFIAQRATGRAIGLLIPSYASFAGYFLASSTFFGLAYAFSAGAHIRVTLVLNQMPAGLRRGAEIWSAAVAAAISGYFAWYTVSLMRESLHFGDVSSGLVPIPLWIPQLAMAAGTVALTIATLDRTVRALRGDLPTAEGEDILLVGGDTPDADGPR